MRETECCWRQKKLCETQVRSSKSKFFPEKKKENCLKKRGRKKEGLHSDIKLDTTTTTRTVGFFTFFSPSL